MTLNYDPPAFVPWYCDYKHALPHPVYVILVMEPREVLYQVSYSPQLDTFSA